MGATRKEFSQLIPLLNDNKSAGVLMEAFNRTIRFDLDGEPTRFFIVIAGNKMGLSEKASGDADIIVSGQTDELARVVRGEIDVTHLIANGNTKISKGKVSEMTLLNRIIAVQKRR